MQGKNEYQSAYDNAVKLLEAGTITNDMFVNFVATLNTQFSPAVRDAAWATQEAARIMQQNLSALSQQWNVFGTDAQGQLSDLTSLYGFGGMSALQVQSLFTKVTPGQELTETQLQTNQWVSEWFTAYRRAQQASESSNAMTPSSAGTTWNPGPTADIPILGEDTIAVRSARSITESSAMKLVDYSAAQLSVQREILAELKGRGARQTSALTSPLDGLDRVWGTRVRDRAMLVNGRIQ